MLTQNLNSILIYGCLFHATTDHSLSLSVQNCYLMEIQVIAII